MSQIFNDDLQVSMGKLLDLISERHRHISANLANVNTPGFSRSDIQFYEEVQKAMENGDLSGIKDIKPEIVFPEVTARKKDGNNVDLPFELTQMGENQLQYDIYTELLKRRMQIYKLAMKPQ